MLTDQSSQERFDQKEIETNTNNVTNANNEFQSALNDTTKNVAHFELLQLETSSQGEILISDKQPQQSTDINFINHH